MATLIKQENPDHVTPGRSYYHLELSDADVREIRKGGFAVVRVILPISDPDAEIAILKGAAVGEPAKRPVVGKGNPERVSTPAIDMGGLEPGKGKTAGPEP